MIVTSLNGGISHGTEIFIDVVSAFEYLEKNRILHRDIRPANFLVDDNGNVKIIDFGFGKNIDPGKTGGNSIVLNWPVTEMPAEINKSGEYNHQTEIYFVGMLFKKLLDENYRSFKFINLLEKMIELEPENRIKSFEEVSNKISTHVISEINFTSKEKSVYQNMANELVDHIYRFHSGVKFVSDLEEIIKNLGRLIIENSLEEYIQANSKLIQCFISGGYKYSNSIEIKLNTVKEFYDLLLQLNQRKQKIIIDNLHNRFSRIPVDDEEDLPF